MSGVLDSFSSQAHQPTHTFFFKNTAPFENLTQNMSLKHIFRTRLCFITINLTYRFWRGGQAADWNGTIEEGVGQREEQHQEEQDTHEV